MSKMLADPGGAGSPSCRSGSTWPATTAAPAASARDGVFRVGYFARVAPEKGLHVLAEAYQAAPRARDARQRRMRLDAAGYMWPAQAPYLDGSQAQICARPDSADEFTYHGAVDRDGKLAFLRSLDVLSVPATYDEPKGVVPARGDGEGVPVVQPRRGAFTEIVEKTGGGLLVAPGRPDGAGRRAVRAVAGSRARRRARPARLRRRPRALQHRALDRSADGGVRSRGSSKHSGISGLKAGAA